MKEEAAIARAPRPGEPKGRLRVGLLGAGRIARRFHLPILASMPGVDLVAVAEPLADARDACLNLAPGTTSFHADYAELLDAHPLDAVVICLPPALHSRAAVAGFARGLHVYVEKPLAISAGDGRGMLDAWRRAGTVGMVGFNHRFHPLALALKDEVARGRVGDVTLVRTAFAGAQRTLPAWKCARESGGGALLDLASHQVDLVRFLFDAEIVDVSALTRSAQSEGDTTIAALRLSTGPLVCLCASLAATEEDRIEVHGTRGGLVFDRYRSSRLHRLPERRDFRVAARLRTSLDVAGRTLLALRDALFPPRDTTFALALESFVAAARGGGPAKPDLDDGMASLAVVLAAERSARDGVRAAP